MPITTCPHCQMRIWPRPDGSCPSCNGLISQLDAAPPSPKSSAAVIKRRGKAADRRTTASKKGRSTAPAAPSPREVETAYQDYLQTAKDVRRGSLRVFYPYLAWGIVIAVAGIAFSFLTWEEKLVINELKYETTPFTWVLIWGGIVVCLGLIVLGAVKGDQWGHTQAREIAKDRAGFPDFYKAFLKRYWPKEGTISGQAQKRFLTFLGKT